MVFHDLLVMHRLVIEAGHIHFVSEMIADSVLPIIKSRSCGPSWVFFMKEAGQALGFLPAVGLLLFWDFVADAPQNDAGVVPVATDHFAQLPLRPLVLILAVTIAHFLHAPPVE